MVSLDHQRMKSGEMNAYCRRGQKPTGPQLPIARIFWAPFGSKRTLEEKEER